MTLGLRLTVKRDLHLIAPLRGRGLPDRDAGSHSTSEGLGRPLRRVRGERPVRLTRNAMSDRPLTLEAPDVQAQPPSLALGLSRVGVTGVEKVIRVRQHGAEQLFSARLECFVDLAGDQKGAHMSRFEEVVNEAIGEVVLGEATFRAETLAQHVAELVRERQGARRAEVTIAARYPEHQPAPVSGINTQEIYTLYGMAVASRAGHAPSCRRRRAGDDRLPVRAGAGRRRGARAAARAGLRASRSSGSSRRCRSPPTTSAGWARCRSARPRPGRWRSTRGRCWTIVEAVDVVGDL